MHGKESENFYAFFNDEFLNEFASEVLKRSGDEYIYFLNDADGVAPQNARTLINILKKSLGEEANLVPNYDITSSSNGTKLISNCFTKKSMESSSPVKLKKISLKREREEIEILIDEEDVGDEKKSNICKTLTPKSAENIVNKPNGGLYKYFSKV